MPAYNAELYIGPAIRSVLEQTFTDFELIIINDGSTDRTAERVAQILDNRVRLFHQRNSGQCAAANRALHEARGDYIKFFDADDLLHPQMLERQLSRLKGRSNCVASAEWGRFYDDDLNTFKLNPQSVWKDMEATDWLVEAWMDARPMMQCALWLIPRTVLTHAGGWDERLSLINDFEFFSRVLCQTEDVLFTPGCPLYYRSGIRGGSLSSSRGRKAAESAFLSNTSGVAHLLRRRSDQKAKLACANILQDFIYSYYPNYPDLRAQVGEKLRGLSVPTLKPGGGRKFQIVARILGWRIARRLCG